MNILLLLFFSSIDYFYWDSSNINSSAKNHIQAQLDFLDSSFESSDSPEDWAQTVLSQKSELIQILKNKPQDSLKDNFHLIAFEKSFFFPKNKETWIARIKVAQIFHHESDFGQNYFYFCPSYNQPKEVSIAPHNSSLFNASKQYKNSTLFLALTSLIFIVFHFIQLSIIWSKNISSDSILISFIILLGLNFSFYSLFLIFQFDIIYSIPSFKDLSFSNDWFNLSLGELILFLFLSLGPLSYLNSSFLMIQRKLRTKENARKKILFYTFFFFSVTLGIIIMINKGLHNMMLSSNININPKNILDLDVNSFISLIYIGILYWAFFLTILLILRMISLLERKSKVIITLGLSYFIYVLIYYYYSTYFTYYEIIWPTPIFIYLGIQFYSQKRITGIISIYINIAIIALFSSLLINHLGTWKKEEQLINIGQEIAKGRNLVLEYHYNQWHSAIQQKINNPSFGSQPLYLDSLFRINWIRNKTKIITEQEGINKIQSHISEEVPNAPQLYRLYPPIGPYFYASKIKPDLYVLFQNQWEQNYYGIASNQFNLLHQLNFQEAINIHTYYQGKLTYTYGDLSNAPVGPFELQEKTELLYKNKNTINYIHQYPKSEYQVIISVIKDPWYQFIFIFSFLFIFYFILLLSAYLLSGFKLHFNFDLLSVKVPLLFILGILLSVGFYAVFVYYSAQENFQKEYREYQKKEIQWVTNYLNTVSYDEGEQLIMKLKQILKNELILYHENGEMMQSTLSEDLTQDLGLDQIQAAAWYFLQNSKSYITQRKMGTFVIDSEWIRFKMNQKSYFLQIPRSKKSFFKSNDFKSFTQSIFNVLTLLISFSLILGTFLSRNITSSLQMISTHLSKIALGTKNKRIPIQGQGEVAQLIKVYNQKVEELDASLKLINQQERSLAWKEVAQQVAHEIKNPLTPMKLSTQYLQKKISEKENIAPNQLMDYLMSQLAQIENLVHIADHFSKFSKLPRLERSEIDLLPIIHSISNTFNLANTYSIHISSSVPKVIIYGDQGLISQVINNLLKNAIQAQKTNIPLEITISIRDDESTYFISFQDNGIGMTATTLEQIFIPNFTTKSSGSGIGLALCDQILKEHEGSIEVTSQLGEGSIFLLKIPKFKG